MSTSEADTMSDSNLDSPFSQTESPYSSPSQQVPQLANNISELSCTDKLYTHNSKCPELRIVEQPQNHFRFRYKSEMIGTHGCLLGKSSNKLKTHPTVELRNFTGKALLRCRLARHDKPEEHPHKLLEDDQDRDVSSILPEHGSYRVAFSGMGIIHTAKKDVPAMLYKKYATESAPDTPYNENKLRVRCENEAKNINLNIVRLKFSAHDLLTDKEICPPVFSEPIHNMKSAATNDLKICRISRYCGRPKGGDDVFIFVEKVNKKNIKIRFFELDENGDRVWTADASFPQSDVHHQYGIVFKTPAYSDPKITSDVKVLVELVRPSDGRTSEPREFTYKAESIYCQTKKRKANSSYSSFDSSIKSFNELPITIDYINQSDNLVTQDEIMNETPAFTIKVPAGAHAGASSSELMADAIWSHSVSAGADPAGSAFAPLLGAPAVAGPPVLSLHSSEMERILEPAPDERRRFLDADLAEYFQYYDGTDISGLSTMDFIKSGMLVADSGRITNIKTEENNVGTVKEENSKNIKKKTNIEYSAFYKAEDGVEVKKLVKELCEMIRNKTGHKKQMVRNKLERLFEMRLSNGDTFLHMTLCSNQPSLEYIVKLIHSMKMTKLLNLKNDQMQTILHLAVINDLPRLVTFLVSKGCNPMEEDGDGNNAIHYAVIYQSCIEPLLDAIKTYSVPCDINAYNNEKQTALHLATIYRCADSVRALRRRGASALARDAAGRAPLHLAAAAAWRRGARDLLQPLGPRHALPADRSYVDMVDGNGYTPLQIICDGEMKENTLEIAKHLLENKADPTKHEEYNQPAWKLARDKPALLQLLQAYMDPRIVIEDDIKSEPEDEFESADEDEAEPALAELPQFVDELAAALERDAAWRELARRLARDALSARHLLLQLKDSDIITTKSLAHLLEDMGEVEAASIVKRYVYY
ncbi:nuclear factor NF-kappa-B p110 subunit isoform X2 [Nymphalis io]|uniref:nuclear factor NF-kappa-B p110 subunit isoform X2 n=1 Tax=Inachis io TaxID=171585 RepID=UPI002167CCFF|nr:nuclear factor NF-kappa-B p110 subunit isoform X2 [Nymphalis io]